MKSLLYIYYLMITFVLFFFNIMIMSAHAQWPKEEGSPKTGLVLENDFVRFEFEEKNMGVRGMIDKISGINHVKPVKGKHLLWELAFRAGTQEALLNNNENPCAASYIEELKNGTQRAVMIWEKFRFWREDRAHNIHVTVELPKDCGIAKWSLRVDNNSSYWGLWEIRFPYFTGFLEEGKYDVAVPWRTWGNLEQNLNRPMSELYPSARWPMQFLSATQDNASVYLATHDGQAWGKKYYLYPGNKFYFDTYAENMGVAGSDFFAPFPAMVGVYQGNWLQATKIYRKWALEQLWTMEGPLSKRASVPDIEKNIGLWYIYGSETNEMDLNKPIIEAQKYLESPIGIHWYGWHKIKFDNNYPHYIPAREGFKDRVVDLVNHGILVMPYINARLVDYDNADFSEDQPFATKDETGTPYVETYGTASGRLVPMCPYTEHWQDKIAGIVNDLNNLYGINGIYLDQISAAGPRLCFDKSHNHPVGGGGWWLNGYQRMLLKVQQVAHTGIREMVITSEDNAEPYMNKLDAFLIDIGREGKEVPLITSVYSGYTLYFASPVSMSVSDRAFRMLQGRDFAWGCQNGWMGFDMFEPKNKEKAAYFKKIGQYRLAAKKFVTYGELLNVITPVKPVPLITESWGRRADATLPCVMGALWKAEDENLGVIITNFLDEPQQYTYSFDPAQFGLKIEKDKCYAITKITPGDNNSVNREEIGVHYAAPIARTESLSPQDILVLEIGAKK